MKSIFKSLAGNTIIFAIGNSVSILLAFFMVPFYTKMLTPSEFGISDIITTTTAMLLPLVSLNIFSAIFRFALDDENHSEIFTNGFIISLIGSIISISISSMLELFGLKFSFLVGLYLALSLFLSLFQNFARGINNVKSFALSGIVATITNIVSNLILMWVFKWGLNGYLYSLIISTTLTILFLFLNNNLRSYIKFNKRSWITTKELLTYSIPMIPNSFAWWLTNDANKIIILMFLGPSANGILAVANKIPTMSSTIFGMFANAWQMTAVSENGKDHTKKLYTLTFNLVFGTLLVGSAIVVILIKWFMSIYVSNQFFDAWKIVPILLLTAVFSNMSAFLGTIYLVNKKTKGLFTTTLWGTIINITLSLILIPIVGLNGAGLSGAIGFCIVSLLRLSQTKKFIDFNINYKTLLSFLIIYILISVTTIMNVPIIPIILLCIMIISFTLQSILLIRKEK